MRINHVVNMFTGRVKDFHAKVNFHCGIGEKDRGYEREVGEWKRGFWRHTVWDEPYFLDSLSACDRIN
jgi:REP element-mobilizing transposase RayT